MKIGPKLVSLTEKIGYENRKKRQENIRIELVFFALFHIYQ